MHMDMPRQRAKPAEMQGGTLAERMVTRKGIYGGIYGGIYRPDLSIMAKRFLDAETDSKACVQRRSTPFWKSAT